MAQVDASGISADLRKEVEDNVNKLIAAMDAIDKAVVDRLTIRDQRAALTKTLTDDHAQFLSLAQPSVDQAVMDMTMEFELVSRSSGPGAGEMIQSILDKQEIGRARV